MRGKVHRVRGRSKYAGITPAYAGKSTVPFVVFLGLEDHPRLCGEKPRVPAALKVQHRITPAYAGKSV